MPEQAPGNRRVVYTTMGTAMKINRIQTPIGLPGLTVNALILAACSDRGDDLTGGISQARIREVLRGFKAFAAPLLIVLVATLTGCVPNSPATPPNSAGPQLTSIAVGPPDTRVAMGLTHQFTASGLYSDGSKQDVSSTVTWSSSNAAIAAVSNAASTPGLATTVSAGSTTITATLGNVSGSTTLTVTAATLVSIGVTPTNASIANGLTESFKATGVYTDNSTHDLTTSVSWKSSTTGVASINNAAGSMGLATALSVGSSSITATLGSVSGSTTLTVTAATLVSIGVTPANPSLAKGTQLQLVATGVYTDHSTHNLTTSVTWGSSATSASVSNSTGSMGLVTALSPGPTTISATLGAASGSTTLTVTAATLVSIGITPPSSSIAKGLTDQFTAMGTYSDNSTQNLTTQVAWSSTDPTVASVSNASGYEGLGTALNPGSATVTATIGSVSGSATLTVTPATLVSIGVTPVNPSIANGLTVQFTATGVYTDNSTQNLTATVAWTSSNTNVVSISNASGSNGLATSMGTGSVTITAASGSVSGAASLTVTPATLVSIGVTPPNPSIANGTSQQFTATGTYTDNSTQNLTSAVTWSSSASSAASISNASGSNGLATAASQGSATITAALGNISGSSRLTVTAATLVSIGVTPTNPSIANGLTDQFTATGIYTDNSTQSLTASVTWSSSDPSVASVSNASGSNGLATATSQGSVTITAALGNVSGSTGLTVTAATLVSIGITPTNPSIANGLTDQFTATGIYTDNSTQSLTASVTWSSSDTTVASISNAAGSQGLATSAGVGTALISASLGSVSGSTGLTVTAATLVSISVTPATQSIASGTSEQFAAVGTYTDNSTQDLTTQVSWTSSTPATATISNASGSQGVATSAAVGTTTIAAALGNVSGSTTLNVTAATLVSISVTPANITIASGYPWSFSATGVYTDGSMQNLTAAVTWNSSNSAVASVSNAAGCNGCATALTPGSASITAALQGIVSDPATVTVTPAILVSIGVNPSNPSIGTGASQRFAATGNYSDGSSQDVTTTATWNSLNSAVASISNAAGSNGFAIAVGVGTTSITATVGGVTSPPATLTVTASPEYAYIAVDDTAAIAEYTIAAGGALTQISPALPATAGALSIAVNPTGPYVYVSEPNDNTISQYTIGAGGSLVPMNPATVPAAGPGRPFWITVDPLGRYVYVGSDQNSVSQYTIGTNGALTPMNPAAVATGNVPFHVTEDPTGRCVYVANQSSGTISQFTIGATGALVPMTPATVAAGSGLYSIAVDPTGSYVYATNSATNVVLQFTIGTDGALIPMSPASVTAANPSYIAVDPMGRYLYTSSGDTAISQYVIGAGGALAPMSPATVGALSEYVDFITVDATGQYVYLSSSNGNILIYSIGTGGALTQTGTLSVGPFPSGIATIQ